MLDHANAIQARIVDPVALKTLMQFTGTEINVGDLAVLREVADVQLGGVR